MTQVLKSSCGGGSSVTGVVHTASMPYGRVVDRNVRPTFWVVCVVLSMHADVKMPFSVDGKWIAVTEAKLGVCFPASFVASMAKSNGRAVAVGNDVFWLYLFLDASDRKRLQRTCSSICRETVSMRSWEHFPKELVVIGHNAGGDLLVLKPMTDHATVLEHTVYWWDHETSEISPVADDFSTLKTV